MLLQENDQVLVLEEDVLLQYLCGIREYVGVRGGWGEGLIQHKANIIVI